MTLKELLVEFNACNDAREWACDKSIEEIVETCERGDWLLWLAKKVEMDLQPLTLAKGHCAATVLHLMKDERSKKAVQVAIDFGNALATRDQLDAAYTAATAAYTAATAAYTAAAYTAAAYTAADAYASYAASYAADAAAADAAYAAAADAAYAAADAKKENQKLTADICREHIGDLLIKLVNNRLN